MPNESNPASAVRPRPLWRLLIAIVVLGPSCQAYEYAFQPDTNREGIHLRFTVEQPSKADMLFVIDNSRSMGPKQEALKASFGQMLDDLSRLDTSYRIGIVSTDAQGLDTDCCGERIRGSGDTGDPVLGNKGDCLRCDCVIDGTTTDCNADADCDVAALPPGTHLAETCDSSMPPKDPALFTGRCIRPCTIDEDCPGAQTCDTDLGRCFGTHCLHCRQRTIDDDDVEKRLCSPEVTLGRPHDGALGRLLSAYDPMVFDIDAVVAGQSLYPDDLIPRGGALENLLVDELFPKPTDAIPSVPWVIDRETLSHRACEACGITAELCTRQVEEEAQLRGACCNAGAFAASSPGVPCDGTFTLADGTEVEEPLADCGPQMVCGATGACTTAFEECAEPLTRAMVIGYFNSNVNGLGTEGFGWEEGIKSAMLAVGIDPLAVTNDLAADPGSGLTSVGDFARPSGANVFAPFDLADPREQKESWVRPDALLAVMFVTDEEDCSMTPTLLDQRRDLEGGQPPGSLCYMPEAKQGFLSLDRMVTLLTDLKRTASQFTIGLIGGAQPSGGDGRERRSAVPSDCAFEVTPETESPTDECSCMSLPEGPELDQYRAAWCDFTVAQGFAATCDGMAGYRYIDFANKFRRKTFDSVCRACPDPASGESCEAFGPALRDFAKLATLACFELGDVRPAGCRPELADICNPDLIEVRHRTASDVERGVDFELLPRVEAEDSAVEGTGGWFYEPEDNRICLLGLDRAIGDQYDVFILHTDRIDFSR